MRLISTSVCQGQIREFTIYADELEAGLEAISLMALSCERILSVALVEGESICQLPPEAFDGQPISPFLKQIEQQWQVVLNSPTPGETAYTRSAWNWHDQQLYLLQTFIDSLHQLMHTLGEKPRWLQTSQLPKAHEAEWLSSNQRFISHCQSHVASAQRRLLWHLQRMNDLSA